MSELIMYHLRVFHSVARNLSYSKAGDELALSQPAVSRQIAALEKGLGLELFSKHGRRVVLTDAGRTLYDYSNRIMNLLEQAGQVMAQYHDLERGEINLGATLFTGSYILPLIIKDFQARLPNIKISIKLADESNLIRWILEGKLDLALTPEPKTKGNLYMERYLEDKLVLVYPPEELNLNIDKLFNKYPLITGEKNSPTRNVIENHLSNNGVNPQNYFEISDDQVIKQMVITGLGAAFLPFKAVQMEIDLGLLKVVSGRAAFLTRWIYWVTAKEQNYCPALLAFINFLRKSVI
ncbi:LysR family transcriptional regulator [Desulfolucanica intricata]|uniref:LysR family transcriptional regulator n=1 Tax=Desulfolucanica intricata TaxID=1285191 RepID=UPI000832119A|nr:LysR family transcriptional regulator [Desulfolucanica intricata]